MVPIDREWEVGMSESGVHLLGRRECGSSINVFQFSSIGILCCMSQFSASECFQNERNVHRLPS